MSKEEMIRARELIKQKRFDEARIILRSTSHPQAAAWLAKLDEIDPPMAKAETPAADIKPPTPASPPLSQPKTQKNRDIPLPIAFGCLGLALLAGLCTIGVVWAGSNIFGDFFSYNERSSSARNISYGVPVNGFLSEENNYEEFWAFQAAAGDILIITMRSADFDAYLSLYSEEGHLLVEDDDSGGGVPGFDAEITYTVREGGRYVIATSQFFLSDEGGPYTLLVQR